MIKTVLAAGTGSIGSGVAKSFANSGFRTWVLTRDPARLQGQFPGAELVDRLPNEKPDLVVESFPERLETKSRFYAEVEEKYGGRSVLATNTSGLSIDDLARGLRFPGQFLGMHYLYPADLPRLFVEVIPTEQTDRQVVGQVMGALERCDKHAILLSRPVVGGIFNRLQHALLREAYYLVDQGVATPEQIDDMARQFLAPRMCITGLLQQKDINGLETHALAQRAILPHLCSDATPSKCLQDKYKQGQLGLKTGRGFYDWSGAEPPRVRRAVNDKVARIVKLIKELGPLEAPWT